MTEGINIFCFHLDETQPPNRQTHTILPAMVLSETTLSYHSTLAAELNWATSDIMENHLPILANFVYSLINISHGEEIATKHYNEILRIHKLRQKKFKTKAEMTALLIGRKMIKQEVDFVKTSMQWRQVTSEMHRLVPFYRKGYYAIMVNIDDAVSRQKDATADEKTIKGFIDMLTQAEENINLCMENTVKEMEAKEITGDAAPFVLQGFLKLPIFELPGFLSFKASKFALLRNELQPELGQWWKALSETLKSMEGIDYAPENAWLIQQNLLTWMKPEADALQKKTEQSIYLQQLANDELGEYRGKWSLGITSVQNLLHAYHNSGQISDAAMQEVEEYFQRRNEAGRLLCFLLHEVPQYPPFVKYLTADHEYLNGAWKAVMEEIYPD
jgi:hypothetical protein